MYLRLYWKKLRYLSTWYFNKYSLHPNREKGWKKISITSCNWKQKLDILQEYTQKVEITELAVIANTNPACSKLSQLVFLALESKMYEIGMFLVDRERNKHRTGDMFLTRQVTRRAKGLVWDWGRIQGEAIWLGDMWSRGVSSREISSSSLTNGLFPFPWSGAKWLGF